MSSPTGLSAAAAIQRVIDYSNEPNLPGPATILRFLNAGLEEVVRRIGGIRLWAGYQTVVNQTMLTLNPDVQNVISANFSVGFVIDGVSQNPSPFAQGSTVYPMTQLEQATFMDAAAGFPNVGFGPPQAYFVFEDQGSAMVQPPVQPSIDIVAGTSNGATVEIVITFTNPLGESLPSPAADAALTVTDQALLESPLGDSNISGYNVYVGPIGGPYHLQNGSTPIPIGTSYLISGTPLTGTAVPPISNTANGPVNPGQLSMQLYPAAMLGQVNIYYRARPQLYADTSANSWTNLDSSAHESVVLYAVIRTLYNRQRAAEAKEIWEPEFNTLCPPISVKESLSRRTQPGAGQVRDVTNRSYPSSPWWMTG